MRSFAIVTPHLNQARFLKTALESLRHQTVPLQMALVDGGSDDGFEKVLRGYAGGFDYYRSGTDRGQSDAINEGAGRIGGDIFAWLNADDYYFPGTLERVGAFFDSRPDVDVVYGDAVHVTPEGFFLSYFPAVMPFDPRALPFSCFICQPACFMRRSVFEAVGGLDPGLRYTMDWDLWCRLMRSGARFEYLPDVLAAVRYYPNTKTLSRDRRRYAEIWRIQRTYGGSLLPYNLAGFYRFDLTFKPNPSSLDRLLLKNLDRLRSLKRRIRRARGIHRTIDTSLYGFRRWETVVEGRGVIKLPWYGDRQWRTLRLPASPRSDDYRLSLNDLACERLPDDGECLVFSAPPAAIPYREISVENRSRSRWRLEGLSFTV